MFYFSRESRINYSLYEEAIKLERYSFDFFLMRLTNMAQTVCSLYMENNANWQIRSKTKMESEAIKRLPLF